MPRTKLYQNRRKASLRTLVRMKAIILLLLVGSLISTGAVLLRNNPAAQAVPLDQAKTITLADGTQCVAHIAQDPYYDFQTSMNHAKDAAIDFYGSTGQHTALGIFSDVDNGISDTTIADHIKVDPSPAQRVHKFLDDNAGRGDDTAIIYIYFDAKSSGSDTGYNSPESKCLRSSMLFEDPGNPTLFVGWFWNTTSGAKATYQEAVYDPAKQTVNLNGTDINFTPNPNNLGVTLHKGDQIGIGGGSDTEIAAILASSSLNPTPGVPPATTDPCGAGLNADAYASCNTPTFVDSNTITWKREIYTLARWDGSHDNFSQDGMRYYLTKANEITHHQSDIGGVKLSQTPYLQIRTDGGGADSRLPFNIDDFNSSDDHFNSKEFFESLNRVDDLTWWGRQIHWVDFDSNGNRSNTGKNEDTKIAAGVENLRRIASLYGDSTPKEIDITLGAGSVGPDEQNYIVPYKQDATNPLKFVAATAPPYSGGLCSNAFPSIVLASEPTTGGSSAATWSYPKKSDCSPYTGSIVVQLAPAGTTPPLVATTNTDTGAGTTSCESLSGFIGWLACPVIKSLSSGIQAISDLIQEQLKSDVPAQSRDTLKAVWVRLRDIAYIILLPIMLVMVIGTALNIGPFDAYTVKKALPRMVAGVIFIALSWYICMFLINVTNTFGSGVQGIIEAPFSSAVSARCPSGNGITLACVFDGGVESAVSSILVVGPIIAAFILILWFFLGTVLLFLAVIFGVIILRRIFVLALLLVSPLAILPWIFPSNNKLWKAWWDSFSRLLIVYPLIMILLTMGHIFAFIVDSTDAGGIANFLIKIAAFVLPLVFIKTAFSFAGGAFATLSGMANDRSKGLFDRQKKSRADKFHRLQNDQFFKKAPAKGFRRKVNSALGMASNANQLGINPNKWKAQLKTNHMGHAIAGSQKLMQDQSGTAARVLGDDNFMYAAVVASNRDQFMKMLADTGRDGASLDNNGADYDNLVKEYGLDALKLAAFDKAAAGGTMFGYKDKDGKRRLSSMAAAAHLAHGDTGLEAYLNGRIRSISTNAGRPDEGLLSHGSAMAISESERTRTLMDYDEDTGAFVAVDEFGRREGEKDFAGRVDLGKGITADPEIMAKAVARRSFAQSHGSQWMGPSVKDPATQRGIELLKENLDLAFASGDTQKIAEAEVKYDEFFKGATSDQKREMLAKGVSRNTRSLSRRSADNPDGMTDEMLAMLGDGIYKTEQVQDRGPNGDIVLRTVVHRDQIADKYRNKDTGKLEITDAEILRLTRGSKEVQEVSYQFNNVYEAGGPPPPPGGMPDPTAGPPKV